MDFTKWPFSKKEKKPEESFEICYTCNECLEVIKDGAPRFNCTECVESYDLCKKCMKNGKGTQHTLNSGSSHTFVMETQPFSKISRLVFSATSLQRLVLNMFKYYKDRPAIGQYDKMTNSFKFLTFGEVAELATYFSGGLKKLLSSFSYTSDTMVSMCSMSRLEWYITDLACLFLGYITVPLNTTNTKDQMKYILNKAESTVLVCSLKMLEENLSDIVSDCPNLKLIVLMDIALTCSKKLDLSFQVPDHVQLIKFSEVMTVGKELQVINFSKIKHDPSSMFTVQFTSGSTGDPKGCVFTRATWKKRISKCSYMGYLAVWLSYHPPSHNLERKSFYVTLLNGGKIGIFRGAMEHLFDDFALLRPTIIASTPRMWTSLYNEYLKALYEAFVEHKTKAITSAGSAGSIEAIQSEFSMEHFDLDQVPSEIVRQIMSQFKSRLGGRERMITTGGAATDPAVLKFIIYCFKGMVNDGYGSTEVGGIASDGLLFASNDVKLVDVPEMGYFTSDNPPRGEITIKTPEMIDGYFKDPEVTAKKFVNGYFCTGDIGMIDSTGKIKIIDRKKNIFKLSQGEFVSPESLENLYSGASHYIDQIYVYGSSLHSNIVAVVVPDRAGILHIARSMGMDEDDLSNLYELNAIKEVFLKELQAIARKNSLPGWEVPIGIILEVEPFTPENNLLTSTMKVNRPRLERKYKDILEELYTRFHSSASQSLEISVFEKIKSAVLKKESGELHQNDYDDADMFEKSFSQLGGDSLSAMQLSSLLREHLQLDVPAEVLLKEPLKSILPDMLRKSSKTSPNCNSYKAEKFPNWNEEVSLKEFLEEVFNDPRKAMDCSTKERASCVLLTGSTGFLGRFILSELLLDPAIEKVYCLIQKKDDLTPNERLLNILQQLSFESGNRNLLEELDKMIVVAGNLAESNLGLSSEDYEILLESVDTIVHNGAVVNSALPYSALKSSNVNSTKELIKMAMLVRPKFIHFVSTIGVYPFMAGCVDESVRPPIERLNELSGYSQSKWVAESLVLSAIEGDNIRGNICRPGLIGPHSVTGHANLQDWVCCVIKGFIRLGTVPAGKDCSDKVIHWVPVDQVAKAIIYLGCKVQRELIETRVDLIHHLVNSSSPTTISALTDSLAREVSSIKTSGYEEFRRLVTEGAQLAGDATLGKVDLLLPRRGGWPVSQTCYSQDHKIQRLQAAGINLSHLNKNYVECYLNYILNH